MKRFNRLDELEPRQLHCSIFGSIFGGGGSKKQKEPEPPFIPGETVNKPKRKSYFKAQVSSAQKSKRYAGDRYDRREAPSKDPYHRRGE